MTNQTNLQTALNGLVDVMPDGLILFDREWKYLYANHSAQAYFHFNESSVIGKDIWTCTAEGLGPAILPAYERARSENRQIDVEEYYPNLDRWLLNQIIPYNDSVAVVFHDISKQKNAKDQIEFHKKNCHELLLKLPGLSYRCVNDGRWTLEFISEGSLDLLGISPHEVIADRQKYFYDRVLPEYRDALKDSWRSSIHKDGKFFADYPISDSRGDVHWIREKAMAFYGDNGDLLAVDGIVFDITEQKNHEQKVQYLMRHDFLTGLYNRVYFEEERKRLDRIECLPLTVIIGDINGLKMINDALGEQVGDGLIKKTAEILQASCGPNDVIGRTGGDEFGILMPNADQNDADERVRQIREAFALYNKSVSNDLLGINLSIGYAVKDLPDILIDSTFKLAGDYLGKKKLLERKSYHSAIVKSIKSTMNARSQETDLHAERLIKLTKSMGSILNLPQMELNELELFSTLHDIGKIGVPDHILNKPGKLTDDEWLLMRHHSETGYRIAMSSPELMPIADAILAHHERWDGMGYPRGIAGNEIPLAARILAVADAFDAMTQDRVYRKAMEPQLAMEEIQKNSGSQFDPQVVEAFLEYLTCEFSQG
jgi:diguanylate cyclase (GGDEF)-like protein